MSGIGDPAPDFSGDDIISGAKFTLSDHSGEVILVSFVINTCLACDVEIPHLVNLWNKFQGHGVQIVAVHIGNAAAGKIWFASFGVTFPVIQDDPSLTIMSSYTPGPFGTPHSYVIGRDMMIRKDIQGYWPKNVLEGSIMDVVYMRDPIDVEMVMDVSDSMNKPSPSDPYGDSKLVMMRKAATLITDFLNDHGQVDDHMGLIWFTDDVDEYQTPAGEKLLPIQTNAATLRSQIKAHGTGICTAMGAGLQTAFETLSTSTRKPFVILCTDGMQNIEPKVMKVSGHYEIIDSGGWTCDGPSSVPPHPTVDIATYNTCVHTIGIGITTTYESLLQDVANATGGFYKGTNDPDNDLDLIYFTDLCNCMASGSPAIVHHSTGRFYPAECEAVECFYLNRSARKVSVILSWKESQKSNLTFWLYSPDGRLVDLHNEMKFFESHSMATFYLPKRKNGQKLPYIGQWRIVIRGETQGTYADYHAFVITDDQEVKYKIDFPRKSYEVGDLLPIRIGLTEFEKPILTVSEILMEIAHLRVPLEELLAEFTISPYELKERMEESKYQKDPVLLKIEAMASNPRFEKLLQPVRSTLSLKEGNLECKIDEKGILIPVALEQSGLHSFKITTHCETAESGPIRRTDMISVYVSPGKPDQKQTSVNIIELVEEGLRGALMRVTLRNEKGQLLGPGRGSELKVLIEKEAVKVDVEDQLDGTYQIKLSPLQVKIEKEKRVPVTIMFQGRSIWREMV